MGNFNIRKTKYFIEIIRKDDGRKEVIRLRIASKNIPCVECDGQIKKGDKYIRDRFSATNQYCEYFGRRTNDICLKCWRGEMPREVSRNIKHNKKCKCCDVMNVEYAVLCKECKIELT